MCLLWGRNWVFISQKTAFFMVTAALISWLSKQKRSLDQWRTQKVKWSYWFCVPVEYAILCAGTNPTGFVFLSSKPFSCTGTNPTGFVFLSSKPFSVEAPILLVLCSCPASHSLYRHQSCWFYVPVQQAILCTGTNPTGFVFLSSKTFSVEAPILLVLCSCRVRHSLCRHQSKF
jgi:hypothetical protein